MQLAAQLVKVLVNAPRQNKMEGLKASLWRPGLRFHFCASHTAVKVAADSLKGEGSLYPLSGWTLPSFSLPRVYASSCRERVQSILQIAMDGEGLAHEVKSIFINTYSGICGVCVKPVRGKKT